jgi:hypothetical protein
MSTSKEYKAVKNYFSNALGMNRKEVGEMMQSILNERIEKQLEKRLDDLFESKRFSKYVSNLITRSIEDIKTNGYKNDILYWKDVSFEDYIKREVRDQIRKQLMGKIKIELVDPSTNDQE